MKGQKGVASVPNKHLNSRISYLYQAATYLAIAHANQREDQINDPNPIVAQGDPDIISMRDDIKEANSSKIAVNAQAQKHDMTTPSLTIRPTAVVAPRQQGSSLLLSQLRSISLKAQIRLSPAIKHSICKRCNTILIPGSTSTNRIENASRGGKKAWADILITTCSVCGTVKRFPVGAKRQQKRAERAQIQSEKLQSDGVSMRQDEN